MTSLSHQAASYASGWQWPIHLTAYDRTPQLSEAEIQELEAITHHPKADYLVCCKRVRQVLDRLVRPLNDALDVTNASVDARGLVVHKLLCEMLARRTSFWIWTVDDWIQILGDCSQAYYQKCKGHNGARQHFIAVTYLLECVTDLNIFGYVHHTLLAVKIFGKKTIDAAVQQVCDELLKWGCGEDRIKQMMPNALCEAFLLNHSPRLEDLTTEVLEQVRQARLPSYIKENIRKLSRVLVSLGYINQPLASLPNPKRERTKQQTLTGIDSEWVNWCLRWFNTTTIAPRSRKSYYYILLKAGRWLAKVHPEIVSPAQWTRELAAEWVAAVDHAKCGDWASEGIPPAKAKSGKPLTARAKQRNIQCVGAFFRECQEWNWIPRRFDPRRAFATPRAIRAIIRPNPRVISDDIWAKLLWAGLNINADDLPYFGYQADPTKLVTWYPVEMIRVVAVVWLFAGLRLDEIRRLRVGCVRWQREDVLIPGTEDTLPKDAVCWLDIPVNKTSGAFTKPVDRLVGEAITIWERIRPPQPAVIDPKTGDTVQYLFAYRGHGLGKQYINVTLINVTLIPMLCNKAGLPRTDARGNITSHRARSTIATQLCNAKEPMTLLELKDWLGHLWPSSTIHYLLQSPTKLAKSYSDAGYFGRNLRAVEVLIDQDTVKSGAVAAGEPWRFYDLGHGYCSYEFFDQCPHRMACAKCTFYLPKGSSQAQVLEAKANLLRMKQEIPLSQDEIAAVDDGLEALEKKLVDMPTPAGPTPRQLGASDPGKTFIPIQTVEAKRSSTKKKEETHEKASS
ncbi:tyrosine-type recombinase/integrase [Dictyobacter arantiisoli]|uniref:Integrase n=1 Tax=Dictyobacter arantiisoli TaxID=2014874 RepID=A0A5A5TKW2_9CHLR|nr:tyrosine-type recombinase/integrase [Dictyobacter arantiisoli]GCF11878.1 integrase [Dictyobacter arantiisoli]